MIVEQPASLHPRVNNRRTAELEPLLFEVFRNLLCQLRFGWHVGQTCPAVLHRRAVHVSPHETVKALARLNLLPGSGIMDRCFDLATVPDDARIR